MLKKISILFVYILLSVSAYSQLSYFLSNKFWRLKHAVISGREYNFNDQNSNAPTLQFSGGNIRGNGGCNAYHTRFTINGTSLDISQVMSTRMSCNDMYLNETEYFRALSQPHTLYYDEGSSEFKLINSSNDELTFFAQFSRSGGTPAPIRRVYTEDNNSERVSVRHGRHYKSKKEVKQSKRELAREKELEKKLKKKKLSKKEMRELKALQSKNKISKKEKAESKKTGKGKKSKKELTREKSTSKKSKSAKTKDKKVDKKSDKKSKKTSAKKETPKKKKKR